MSKYIEIYNTKIEFDKKLEDLINSRADYSDINELYKKYSNNNKIYEKVEEYNKILKEINDINELKSEDIELYKGFQDDLSDLKKKLLNLEEQIDVMLIPEDKEGDKNVYLEVRAGVGGSEASLFAREIVDMYFKYAEEKGWKCEVSSIVEKQGGGVKEVVVYISGQGVYKRLRYESGGHRVQRVPVTETSGRVHTSAVTVAVLPEVEDVEVELNPSDLRITTCKASGAGGQHVNTTDSAVAILHIPTGINVEQSSERSQHQNKAKALKILRARIYDKLQGEQQDKIASNRREQVGSGDRSDKIRTYNFPQGRVTDHRINHTIYALNNVLKEGLLDGFIDILLRSNI